MQKHIKKPYDKLYMQKDIKSILQSPVRNDGVCYLESFYITHKCKS
jgi:hypothetical protein